MTNKNSAGVFHIAIVLLVLLIVGVAGYYYISKQGLTPSIPVSQTQKSSVDTSQWISITFSECGASFKYPSSWEDDVSRITQEKYRCDYMYWEPVQEGKQQTDFIIIDVQPDKALGEENVVIDRNDKDVQISESNGVETIVKNKEDKALDGTILKIKNIYLKKGTYYFRILTQYKDERSEVAQFASDIASTVRFTESDSYYQSYSAEVDKYLGDWLNQNNIDSN